MSATNQPMPKPTVWDELFPNRFLKAGLLKGKDVTLTIKDVSTERLPNDKGVEEVHGLLSFEKTVKQFGINKTNGICLKTMFGADLSKWLGKRVTFYPTTDRFGSDVVDAIRVRGSPDIANAMTITIKFKKKKPRQVTLIKTDPNKQPAPATPEQHTEDEEAATATVAPTAS